MTEGATALRHGRRVERAATLSGLDTPTVPAWAIASAALPPVLLTAAWLIADLMQPASYSPIRQTLSVLAGHGGSDRWIMTGAVSVVGACYLVTAAGLTHIRGSARMLLIVARADERLRSRIP